MVWYSNSEKLSWSSRPNTEERINRKPDGWKKIIFGPKNQKNENTVLNLELKIRSNLHLVNFDELMVLVLYSNAGSKTGLLGSYNPIFVEI